MDKDQTIESADRLIWDCGSTLYDSFELKCLLRQLDSNPGARCFSMPHFSLTTPPPPPPPPPTPAPQARKKISNLAKSIKKIIWSVVRSKPGPYARRRQAYKLDGGGSRGESSGSGSLASIPEAWEKDLSSPEPYRKTMSERFTRTSGAAVLMGRS